MKVEIQNDHTALWQLTGYTKVDQYSHVDIVSLSCHLLLLYISVLTALEYLPRSVHQGTAFSFSYDDNITHNFVD